MAGIEPFEMFESAFAKISVRKAASESAKLFVAGTPP